MTKIDSNKLYTEEFNKHYEYVKKVLLNTPSEDILVVGLIDSLVFTFSQQLKISDTNVTKDSKKAVSEALGCLENCEDKVQALLLLMKTVSEILFKSVIK